MKKIVNKFIVGIIVSLFSVTAYAVDVPYTFTANTPAVASQVNANFTALESGVNGVIKSLETTTFIYEKRTTTDLSGVGSLSCAADERVVSAGCFCTGTSSLGQNFSTVVGCTLAGNSAIGGCVPDGFLFDPSFSASPIDVTAVCAKTVVSTPLPTAIIVSAPEPEPDQEAIDATNKLRAQVLEVHEALTNK